MGDVKPLKFDVRSFEYLKLDHRHLQGVERSAEWVVFVDSRGGGSSVIPDVCRALRSLWTLHGGPEQGQLGAPRA